MSLPSRSMASTTPDGTCGGSSSPEPPNSLRSQTSQAAWSSALMEYLGLASSYCQSRSFKARRRWWTTT